MLELFIKQNHFQLVKQFSGHCLPNIIIKRWFKEVCGLLNNFLLGDQLMLKFDFCHVVNKLKTIIDLLPLSTDQKPSQN